MKYQKQISVGGNWAKGSKLISGTLAKIVSETVPVPSSFQDKNGNPKTQDVAKVIFQGEKEPLNLSLNRATINGLVDAFGEESVGWMNKALRVLTEAGRVSGRAVTYVYLIPDGFKKVDDENGYAVIVRSSFGSEASDNARQSAELDNGEGIKSEDLQF